MFGYVFGFFNLRNKLKSLTKRRKFTHPESAPVPHHIRICKVPDGGKTVGESNRRT
jgi:hypothetical protein